jgi:hypothetical protein
MKEDFTSGIKAAVANGTILGVVTLAEFELILKIILLLLTICYTAFQFYKAVKKKDQNG